MLPMLTTKSAVVLSGSAPARKAAGPSSGRAWSISTPDGEAAAERREIPIAFGHGDRKAARRADAELPGMGAARCCGSAITAWSDLIKPELAERRARAWGALPSTCAGRARAWRQRVDA